MSDVSVHAPRSTTDFSSQMSIENKWHALLSMFDLPEFIPGLHGTDPISVATTLAKYYQALLFPLEEVFKQQSQMKALGTAGRPQQPLLGGQQARPPQPGPSGPPQPGFPQNAAQMRGNAPNITGRAMGLPNLGASPVPNGVPQFPLPPSAAPPIPQQPAPPPLNAQPPNQGTPQLALGPSMDLLSSIPVPQPDKNVLDLDMQGIKRKLEGEEDDGKRSRQKTGWSHLFPASGASDNICRYARGSTCALSLGLSLS
jgi:SWI/SNF chromatin-remodeling complex subunit SWI1